MLISRKSVNCAVLLGDLNWSRFVLSWFSQNVWSNFQLKLRGKIYCTVSNGIPYRMYYRTIELTVLRFRSTTCANKVVHLTRHWDVVEYFVVLFQCKIAMAFMALVLAVLTHQDASQESFQLCVNSYVVCHEIIMIAKFYTYCVLCRVCRLYRKTTRDLR